MGRNTKLNSSAGRHLFAVKPIHRMFLTRTLGFQISPRTAIAKTSEPLEPVWDSYCSPEFGVKWNARDAPMQRSPLLWSKAKSCVPCQTCQTQSFAIGFHFWVLAHLQVGKQEGVQHRYEPEGYETVWQFQNGNCSSLHTLSSNSPRKLKSRAMLYWVFCVIVDVLWYVVYIHI